MPSIDTGRVSLFSRYQRRWSSGAAAALGGSGESWREVIRLLTTDRRVVAVDARCAGRSEKPPGSFAIAERAAYRGIYLGTDPVAYAELSMALARLEMTGSDWAAIRAPVLVASGADDFLWSPRLPVR